MSRSDFDPSRHAIFVTLAGSQAHGTARDGSDVDVRGVCVQPLESRLSLFPAFEQSDAPLEGALALSVADRLRRHPTASRGMNVKVECTLVEVAKHLTLCAAGNPNALEVLFADERDWVHETPAWRHLVESRRLFLTRKVTETYLGYALAQLKRIETHRGWLLRPPARKPERSDFGLPGEPTLGREDRDRIERAVADRLRDWALDDLEMPRGTRVVLRERLEAFHRQVLGDGPDVEERRHDAATRSLGLPAAVTGTLAAERRYRAALRHWQSYETWKKERNPARAALEARFGYDTKHAMHLVRLMRTGVEIVETGELRVRRHDAAELIAIRDGALRHDELLAEAERLRLRMREAAPRCLLPSDVDPRAMDRVFRELVTSEA